MNLEVRIANRLREEKRQTLEMIAKHCGVPPAYALKVLMDLQAAGDARQSKSGVWTATHLRAKTA